MHVLVGNDKTCKRFSIPKITASLTAEFFDDEEEIEKLHQQEDKIFRFWHKIIEDYLYTGIEISECERSTTIVTTDIETGYPRVSFFIRENGGLIALGHTAYKSVDELISKELYQFSTTN